MTMRKIFHIICLLLLFPLWSQVQAQEVTSNPTPIIANQAVTITFKATSTSNPLYNYTGDVYMYTGVSTNRGDWRYLIQSEWLDNNEKGKMTRTAANTWTMTMPDGVRAFYEVADNEQVTKIALVVRDATGNKGTPNDVFLNVTDNDLYITLTPGSDQVVSKGTKMNLMANATERCSKFRLLLNDTQLKESSNATYVFQTGYQFATEGSFVLKAEGTSQSSGKTKSASINITVLPEVQNQPRPSGTNAGINITGPTSATLVLYAPEKGNVILLGDFNDWKISGNYMLKKDGDYWWITLNNLESGKEYAFQYLVDGDIKIADPYADKILDPWNDKYIPESVYPNLKPYPEGKTDGIVSVLQTSQSPYTWQVSNFIPANKDKLVIYELLVRDFVTEHSFDAVAAKLDYLKSLGINAIEFMPVNEFEGNSSWGYNPSFYFAVDKYYGTKNAFKALVDECHKRGMAVIIDMVLNHSYGQSPFVQLYWDSENNRPAANNPWYNVTSPNTDYSWGYDFNHESVQTKALVDSINSYWMSEYNIDGYRFDFTKGFTNTPGNGWAYDQKRIDILTRMTNEIYRRNPNAIVIMEHLADNSEEKVLSNADIMLWGNINHSYGNAMIGNTSNSDLSGGLYSSRGWTKPNLVAYMESHDEERTMYRGLNEGFSSGNYNIKNLDTALSRAQLLAAFYLTLPGPKMIWQFGEVGYDYSINTCTDGSISNDCRLAEKPIRWDYPDDPERDSLFDIYAKLIELKKQYPVFESTDISYSLNGAVKHFVWKHPEMNAFVVGNFDVVPQSVNVEIPHAGTWYELREGRSLDIPTTTFSGVMQPGTFRFYVDDEGAVSSIDKNTVSDSGIRIYPNSITYSEGAAKSFEIYDLSGRRISQISNSNQIDTSGLFSGYYIVKVQTDKKVISQKFVKR